MATAGERLREARIAAGLTQEDVARLADVHLKTVSKWENDKQPPHANQLAKIAPRLGVSVGWIRDGEGVAVLGSTTGFEQLNPPAQNGTSALPKVLRAHKVRVWLAEFRTELTKAGMPDDRIEEALRLVTAPELFVFYRAGRLTELTEDEAIVAMNAVATAVRLIARRTKLGKWAPRE